MKLKITSIATLCLILIGMTSCTDWLELGPQDYYGSQSYWKTEAHADGYIDGLHSHLRGATFNHTILFGEVRSGIYRDGVASDGMTTSYGDIRLQNFAADKTGVSNYGNIFGYITNCNLFIARAPKIEMPEAKLNYYLAIAHGLRALYYFDLYRLYGGVPLRLGVEVIDGELDPKVLYMEQSKPAEVMAQIKDDLKKSLDYFGDQADFDPYGRGKKAYWNKAATECLAADVYLWNAKVGIGNQPATPGDLQVAKQYLKNVEANYGLKLLDKFTDIFDTKNKGNDEIIFAVRYAENEASNSNASWLYAVSTGNTQQNGYRADGTKWADPLNLKTGTNKSMEYDTCLFNMYDAADSRKLATFMPSYLRKDTKIEDPQPFDNLKLYGTACVKNIGAYNAAGDLIQIGDYIYYRLAWVYLALAEVANMEGNNADVEKYINLVRERAYGAGITDEQKYTASDFKTNELAILHEKDKELIQEGQRWWDLLRMRTDKAGDDSNRLVFTTDGWLPGMNKTAPILDYATEKHKLHWPLDLTLLGKDPALKQTPGYATGDQVEQVW